MSGIGGQGVQLAARSLAQAAMREGRRVLMFGTYGGMMRGGDTDATVVIGEDSLMTPPVVDRVWGVIAMHHLSWPAVSEKLRSDGFLLLNDKVFQAENSHPGPCLSIGATAIATEAEMPQAGSMVALGAFAAATNIVRLETLLDIAEEVLPSYRSQFAEGNRKAMQLGHDAVSGSICEAWGVAEAVS
ncbi:MAG: 2-oxoacid:acceptor oxidoreductase family protein [Novosphingobium sp.]|nr:2-oxoacid:acceptor oxidoreductase family protein [Novosphingobium sp.]